MVPCASCVRRVNVYGSMYQSLAMGKRLWFSILEHGDVYVFSINTFNLLTTFTLDEILTR